MKFLHTYFCALSCTAIAAILAYIELSVLCWCDLNDDYAAYLTMKVTIIVVFLASFAYFTLLERD